MIHISNKSTFLFASLGEKTHNFYDFNLHPPLFSACSSRLEPA